MTVLVLVLALAGSGGRWMMTRRKSSTLTLLIRLNAALVSSSSPSAIPFSRSPISLPSSRLISTPRWSKPPSLGRAVDNTKRVITPFFRNTSSTSSLPPSGSSLASEAEGTSWGVPSTGIECEITWPEERTSKTVREYRIWPLLYAARLSVPGSKASPPCCCFPCWAHEGSGMRPGRGMLNVCDVGNGCLLPCPCVGCGSVLPESACRAGGGG